MQHSDSIKAISAALVKAQAEIEHAHKNATNPHFRNRYADLTEVIDTVRPVLTKHGISVLQFPGYADGVTTVETVLTHESGEFIAGTAGARVQKDDPQGVGSAITYLRRYSLAAVCAIGQDDDDGEAAVQRGPARAEVPTPQQRAAYQKPSEPVGVKHSNAPEPGFDLSEEIQVGKHKGRAWAWVVEHHPDYVEWACENMNKLTPAQKQVLRAAVELHRVPVDPNGIPLTEPDDDGQLPF